MTYALSLLTNIINYLKRTTMDFQVLTWSVSDPFGTLWHFATRKAAELFIKNECGNGFRHHAKLLEL